MRKYNGNPEAKLLADKVKLMCCQKIQIIFRRHFSFSLKIYIDELCVYYTHLFWTFPYGFAGEICSIYDTLYIPSGLFTLYFPREAAPKRAV